MSMRGGDCTCFYTLCVYVSIRICACPVHIVACMFIFESTNDVSGDDVLTHTHTHTQTHTSKYTRTQIRPACKHVHIPDNSPLATHRPTNLHITLSLRACVCVYLHVRVTRRQTSHLVHDPHAANHWNDKVDRLHNFKHFRILQRRQISVARCMCVHVHAHVRELVA